jgi:phosphoribosylformylglycinamidine cyclo-ligase
MPTRIYVREILAAEGVIAAAHITGGGISENLNRALPPGLDALVDLTSWPIPEVISLACQAAGLAYSEALSTFNMGIGMAVIVSSNNLEKTLEHFSATGLAYHIGSVIQAAETLGAGRVVYQGELK